VRPTTRRAAALAAGLTAPVGFGPSLMPRTPVQQGIVTGLGSTASYALAAGAAGATGMVARRAAGALGSPDPGSTGVRLAGSAAALAAGLAVQQAARRRPHEPLPRAVVRTGGYEVALAAGADLVATASANLVRGLSGRRRQQGAAAVLAVGAAAAGAPVLRRRAERFHADGPPVLPSILAAGGVAAAVQVLSAAERGLSRGFGRALGSVLPGPAPLWSWTGRAAAAGVSAALLVRAVDAAYAKIEGGAERPEPGLQDPPSDPFVSGGPRSLVPYESLSRQGRRYVRTRTRVQFIERVMGTTAIAEPVRVFVGLASAATIDERVQLALQEIDRLGALDRTALLLVSPTGTGYVNYAAVEAVEHLALGDVATVTMQYSLRPSFLSLDEVDVGREQNTKLWRALAARIAERPADRRPRVLMFGESLGAHTSQDAVLHQGTQGLVELGVERALWIGTPFGSGWSKQVCGPDATEQDRRLVGEFDSFEQYEQLPAEQRDALRYVMVTHDEDGVPKFGPPLLVQSPGWLDDPRPAGVPAAMRWAPVSTFLQVFVDMLNGSDVTYGTFAALGHDYRLDLLDFVPAVFDLPATAAQRERIAAALPAFERDFFDFIDGMGSVAKTQPAPGA
jgi:uncharacterized membrane protein